MTRKLEGRVALVTGGAVRVGAAISEALALAGAKVAIHCNSSRDKGDALAERLEQLGCEVFVVQGDLRQREAPARIFDEAEAAFDAPIDALVNNAGIIATGRFESFDAELALKLYEVNALAPMRLMGELAARVKQRGAQAGGGDIINVVDTAYDRAWTLHAAYCASKAALMSATEVAAKELAPLRVNAVLPGTVALRQDEFGDEARLLEHIPLEKIGSPKDIAQAVLYFLEAPWVTGAQLRVDGGRGLHG